MVLIHGLLRQQGFVYIEMGGTLFCLFEAIFLASLLFSLHNELVVLHSLMPDGSMQSSNCWYKTKGGEIVIHAHGIGDALPISYFLFWFILVFVLSKSTIVLFYPKSGPLKWKWMDQNSYFFELGHTNLYL